MHSRVAGGSDPDGDHCETSSSNGTRKCPHGALQFEEAWKENRPELLRRSLKWTNNRPEDAEDALGQAAMAALQKFPRDLCPAEARGWLLRLVYTKCMDIHRERRRVRQIHVESDDSALDSEGGVASLESAVLDDELTTFVRRAIDRLPMRLRTVAELHLFREMRYPEIAERLAISEVAARKRMQHARALLRKRVRAYLEGDISAAKPKETGGTRGRERKPAKRPASPRRSIRALKEYIRRHPRGWKMRWELACRLREKGLLEEAAAQLQTAASRQPKNAGIWMELGSVYGCLGRTGEARATFAVALRWARDEETRGHIRALIEACRDLPRSEK